ncbi:phosphate ABC transporter permease subunit PstC [Spongisporangium articulatum]|uniref:Phosphate transport system permease protein n=1 Tax=Spongisporangium articulatum TaxID=3362603 RepID=A0ABW8AKD1_9ACTN
MSITGHSELDAIDDPMDAPKGTSRRGDAIFRGLAAGSGVIVIALIVGVAAFLISQAAPALAKNKANFLTDRVWDLGNLAAPSFGIPDLLWVTVISATLALVFAVPVSVGLALFLTQYAPRRLATPFAYLVDLLAAVPSIVYGLWGYQVLRNYVNPVQDFLSGTLGFLPVFKDVGVTSGIFLASIVLAIMITPIITAISREVFAQTPQFHIEAAYALGATRWEMIRTAVLPFGRPGVISASMLGLGRALGETIAVAIIISKVADFNWSFFSGGQTFASKIALSAAEFDSPTKTGAYIAAGLVLFILTFIVNAIARIVIERGKAFSE